MVKELSEALARGLASSARTKPLGRRRFLSGTAAGGAALAAGALAPRSGLAQQAGQSNLPPNTPAWTTRQGTPIVTPPYGLPSKYEKDVVRRPTNLTPTDISSWSFTPLQDLHGIITPNGLFFERHHGGVPDIPPDQHRLMIHGLVDRPLIFTMDELMRFPSVSRIYYLECSGNTLTQWKPTKETVQGSHGLVSCVEWTGVPLATLLQEVGVKPAAKWILAEGADAAAMTRSIPIEKAWDDALIAYGQNGEALRPEQGYPVRLLLPGYEGNMSIKWLRRLELGEQPWYTREETSKYTDLMPDGRARKFSFIMEAKSVITRPSSTDTLRGPGFYEVSGIAWTGHGRIIRVDVSTDGGDNWQQAELQEPVLPKALTRFRFGWRWDGSPALLQSRAIDETGYVQPTHDQLVQARGTNSVYHYNAIYTWQIAPNGEITNVHV